MSKPEDPRDKGKQPAPGAGSAGRSASARSIGEELGDLDFEPDALLDSLLSDDPAPSQPPATAKAESAKTEAEAAAPEKLFEPDERAWSADEVTIAAPVNVEAPPLAPPITAPPPSAAGSDDVDDLLEAAAPSVPAPEPAPAPVPAKAPAPPPRPVASPPRPPLPPRPGIPRPAPSAPQHEPPVPDEVSHALLRADEFTELPPKTSSDADIDALVGGLEDDWGAEEPAVVASPAVLEPAAPADDDVGADDAPDESASDDAGEAPAEELLADEGADDDEHASSGAAAGPEPLWTPPNWEQDRPAAVHLAEQDALESFVARAEWLDKEAAATSDPAAKARVLLVASELWAMAGNAANARASAKLALTLTPTAPLAQRQNRLLAAEERDFKTVAVALDTEAKSSANPDVRAHAVYLGAELARLVAKDDTQADRRLDVLHKLDARDPRPALMKLGRELGASSKPAAAPAGLDGDLLPLARALADLTSLRSGAPPSPDTQSLPVQFDRARRALATADAASAGVATAKLAGLPGFEMAASWLAASLLASHASTRPQAIDLLKAIADRTDAPAASRALAARALEQGDPSALSALLTGDAADRAELSIADRVALAALTGGGAELAERWLSDLEGDPRLAPLASAAAYTMRPLSAQADLVCGDEKSRTAVALGHSMVAAQIEGAEPGILRAALERYSVAHEGDPLVDALEAELALSASAAFRVAQVLASWPGADDPIAERDRRLAAGLVHELGKDKDSATREYSAALRADPASEAAMRALSGTADPSAMVDLLVGLSDAAGDDVTKSLLLTEAALRVGSESSDFPALIDRAQELAPGLPFAYRLGKQHARRRGDGEALLSWLRRRKENASDPIEEAFDKIREALLLADSDGEAAAALLADASQARAADVSMHELFERLSPAAGSSRGAWRESVAASQEGSGKVRLLVEAALEYERADDLPAASRAASAAAGAGDSAFARVTAERLAAFGPRGAELAEQLLAEAKAATEPAKQEELYERLSALDVARGDASSALLWQSAILESNPKNLRALRALEHAYLSDGRTEELEPIAATLAGLLDRNEATAHAMLAARLRLLAGNADGLRELAELTQTHPPPSLWALRTLSVAARNGDDDELGLAVERQLSERVARAIDAATLALRAAEAAIRLGKLEDARALLDRAVELVPEHPVALARQAEILEKLGDARGAAEALEALAGASTVPTHQAELWHKAGCLWLDAVKDDERGQAALEFVADLDLTRADVFPRLRDLYVKLEQREKLAELLERRIALTDDPDERVSLEVTRGKALADIGDRSAAKEALSAALDANPDHADALDAFAELAVHEGDWEGAEQAWIRLARQSTEPEQQAEIYRKLGGLYDVDLPNPQRAELSYREVLKRLPNDVGAMECLVQVYGRLGDIPKSLELQTELLNRAGTPEEKRDRTIELSRVQEDLQRDRRKAEATLDKARKTWPQDGVVLRALAEFYRRGGEATALNVLLDRAANDSRRALGTGRFDAALFESLAAVAELRGGTDAARVANATLAALTGQEPQIDGVGLKAGDARLDDLLAPELLNLPLRALLKKVGDALDGAYAMDLRSIRATPLPSEAALLASQVQQMATAFGIHNVEVYASAALGPTCTPASSAPPRLVLGTELLAADIDETARTFLILRALKLLQARASTLSRTAPIDLWPVLAGMLSVFAPTWQPAGVDAKKVAEHQTRLKAALVRELDTDVPVLAMEVIGSIGNRASQLGTAVNQWGNRTALLALGSPSAALLGVALGGGHPEGPPEDASERLKWIVRNPEARDLAVFSVSEQYAEARRRLGVEG